MSPRLVGHGEYKTWESEEFKCLNVHMSRMHPMRLVRQLRRMLHMSHPMEQLLFSCASSKVTICHISHVICQMLMLILCFHVYTQKSLFIGENGNVFLHHQPILLV